MGGSVPEDLRSRIFQAIADQIMNGGVALRHLSSGEVKIVVKVNAIADAVIAELGLRKERRTNPMSSAGYTVDRTTGEQKWHSDIRHDIRYVTDWEADDE